MNQKQTCTKENIQAVANFLSCSAEYFKKDNEGCCCFDLDENFAIYVGWSDGYSAKDDDIIKSTETYMCGGREMCYAVNAAVKCRNDADCADFDFLSYPIDSEGNCWDNGITVMANATEKDYKDDARWFLKNYVQMTNALNKGKIELC